jgi:dTDP-4-amino-4,6-dideoxygalactose transaminase
MKVFESKFTKEELNPINEVIQTGQLGFGPNVLEFEKQFQPFSNKVYNVATNSASASAFMIFAYLKEKYGACDIYTPSLGFASPAWAAKHLGHNIIWVDINDNLLFDINDYYDKRKGRCERYSDGGVTPILMPILYGGVSNIPGFDNIEGGYNEVVVVDSAHCVTPTIKCNFSFFSFHPYKPICSSDGGMISTDDSEATEYFQNYRNFGRQNINGSYDITQEGFKFYMNNLNATIALISLKKYKKDLKIRKNNYSKLNNVLPHDAHSSYYFATELNNNANTFNKDHQLAKHYPLLHKTKYFNSETMLPNTELLHNKIINLPLWTHL